MTHEVTSEANVPRQRARSALVEIEFKGCRKSPGFLQRRGYFTIAQFRDRLAMPLEESGGSCRSSQMSMRAELPNSLNLRFVEGLYADYLNDPASVSPEWRRYFEALGDGERALKPRLEPAFRPWTIFNPPGARRRTAERRSRVDSRMAGMQDRV